MPENIFKIYPPSKNTQNGTKKGAGSWYNEPDIDRLAHINKALELYCAKDNFFDDMDLVWFLKNAVIGDIFLSEEVYQGWCSGVYWFNPTSKIHEVIDNIHKHNTKKSDGTFNEELMQIRKWLGNKYHTGNNPLVFEHVVPAKVYLEYLKNLYQEKGPVNLAQFANLRKNVSVCIVTKGQDKVLNQRFRNNMPDGTNFMTAPFARYHAVGIAIH